MVAYSFRKQFVQPIRVGLSSVSLSFDCPPKRQTIRADRKRHARAGEELQLYCGMRTKHCFLIGRARCIQVRDVVITFGRKPCVAVGNSEERYGVYSGDALNNFAYLDGFRNWQEMNEFWRAEHGDIETFIGVMIEWERL